MLLFLTKNGQPFCDFCGAAQSLQTWPLQTPVPAVLSAIILASHTVLRAMFSKGVAGRLCWKMFERDDFLCAVLSSMWLADVTDTCVVQRAGASVDK